MLVLAPNLKSKIFRWSDGQFLTYGRLSFWKFRENKGGCPTSKPHIFWTNGLIWKCKVSLKRGKSQEFKSDIIFCDLGKFYGDDLLTYILTLKLTSWIKLKNADDYRMSQPYLLPTIYQKMEYVTFLFLSNNKLKFPYVDNIG